MTHSEVGTTALGLMLLLGVYHGINPGMGWLFAVALGMQEQKGSAVVRSLLPIALGHALAIGCVVLAAAFLGNGAAARGHPLPGWASAAGPWDLLPDSASPPALGPKTSWLSRPDALVISYGLGARRGFDGRSTAARYQHSGSGKQDSRPQSHVCCGRPAWQRCWPRVSIR